METFIDIGIVGYDVYRIFADNVFGDACNLDVNISALGADAAAMFLPFVPAVGGITIRAAKDANNEITKSSLRRVKRLVKQLSDKSLQNNGLSQAKTDQLRRIVGKVGGKVRNDGVSGVKGSSAGKPHVQTEGLGKRIDSRHIWTRKGVQ